MTYALGTSQARIMPQKAKCPRRGAPGTCEGNLMPRYLINSPILSTIDFGVA
jgi:hypothetical protein